MQTWGRFDWLLIVIGYVVPALGIGWVAVRLSRGKEAPSRRELWRRRALLALGAVAAYPVALFVFTSFFIKPYFGSLAKMRAVICHSHLKQLSTALALYLEEWDETYPPADRWGDRIATFLPNEEREAAFRCLGTRSPYGYALNRAVAGRPVREIADPETVILVEHDARTRNETVEPGTTLPSDRHGRSKVARMDGSVRSITPTGEGSLVWDSRIAPAELEPSD
ncbi:MAG: hypothetical protein ACK47B_20030 [Armatimonadota bacterium]